MHEDLRHKNANLLPISDRFYLGAFSKCEHATTFFAQEIPTENIDFRVLRKIVYKKKYVLNVSKFILGSHIILQD